MWKGPGQDPGGGPDPGPPPGSSQELSDLKDQFEQQEVLIAQLKEMLRKSEQSNVTQEKVDEYMNSLSRRSARAKKPKSEDDGNTKKTVDIPASQKISLLRQQVEENKAKFAKRGASKKGIEEMVTQLKAQLDDSQQLINQTPLNPLVQDTKVDYSEHSSAQELYMILLTKEKRITDLIAKVQKLESNVLDLQENVKEKDSVIDARTKAITLMTENLSRKGKSTLDTLDETKEQMRKMQENFVSLEAEMKARQMKLLEDLRLKNYEIAELQDINSKLQREINDLKENNQLTEEGDVSDLKEKVKQLEQLLYESSSKSESDFSTTENDKLAQIIKEHELTISQLHTTIEEYKRKESENVNEDEVNKLKKQVEDSNKNMIKVKAQHKSKVKELTKKLDQFKKISDTNAEIIRLEAENCRLNQKVAELEEEKGSLQLKLVESDSVKGSDATERANELETEIQDQDAALEEKDKIISILENEISRSKTEIETLKEELSGLCHLENVQVSSEMASIQFEEQMDSLRNENKQLSIENENITKEKQELLESIEVLKKEKQELSTKLEHYIQENMELIDKLEKLSAEKVSSAESIEIVEGLTQQEKLELEAYQKNLDMVAGNLKASEENLPQAVDLDETVNELTEESSELLQKIELFTVERREVMEKMEQLKQENNTLNLKIKEIENNRDVLAETYEQLQSEKEVLITKLEVVEKENEEIKAKSNDSVASREDQDTQLSQENDVLKQQLNQELKHINELKEEVDNYKFLVESKKIEVEELSTSMQTLQSQLEMKESEMNQLNNNIIDLNRSLADYENENKNLQIKISQLEEHKSNLNQLIDKNQEELESVCNSEWENRRLLESKDNEITKLMKERDNTESVILDLQKAIKEKEKYHKISTELKEKYLTLQRQLEENSDNLQNITTPLETKIAELTAKNKEQLEKMKKIAANLKKKNHEYQQLDDKYKETQNKHEMEMKTLLQQLQDLEAEVSRLQHKVEEVTTLEEKNVQLQNIITDLKIKMEKSQEVSLEQELLLTRENLGSIESSLRAKVQELEMIVETQETELNASKARVNKLEEGIAYMEERKLSLEQRVNELGAQLEEKSVTCEEISRSEDMLKQRLSAFFAQDEAIEKKLQEAVTENQDLSQQNKTLVAKNEKLKKKLEQVTERMKKMDSQQNVVEELEAQNEQMKQQIHCLENDVASYTTIIEENKMDFDKFSSDWQAQFDEILTEKTELMVRCEKFEEELRGITERELGFNDELIEYKTKLEKSEAEIKNYEEQVQQLSVANEEWENLRRLIEEKDSQLETYQKQQFHYEEQTQQLSIINEELEQLKRTIEEKNAQIENYEQSQSVSAINQELESLRKTVQEKDYEIANYQQQILHLQMATSSSQASFFDQSPSTQQDTELVDKLQKELNLSKLKIEELLKKIEIVDAKKTDVVPDSVISPHKEIPTFVWSSSHSDDPFDFVQQTQVTPQQDATPFAVQSGNSQKELLDKIKTLEFMLYTMEKEKEEAISQCHQLTNELTRLVYERQQQMPQLEAQILSDIDIKDTVDTRKELHQIEFEESRPPVTSSLESGPIIEEPVQAREAYLCYGEDAQNIDSQVLSAVDIQQTPQSRRELHQLEFEETRTPFVSDQPVQEDKCVTKDSYLCYTFGENDDGWGWGPEEAKLEEEHVQRTEGAPFKQMDSLKEKIRVLEMERENYLEEIKQLQIKSGKLIKKLKEFKQKNEELNQSRKRSEVDLFNLDDAIQEELKLQIQQVEKKLKETTTELEKEKNEKSTLLKRIDVLTAANERMVDMKEKQDVELLSWQRQYRELNTKLERFEWGDDGFSSSDQSLIKEKIAVESGGNEDLEEFRKKIEELNDTIKDLTLDNEELQTLLEEQRTLRMNAEKSKSVEPVLENMKTETEYLEVVNQLRLSGEEKKQLQDKVNELIKKNEELLHTFEGVEKQNGELIQLISTKEVIIERLNENIRILEDERSAVEEAKKSLLEELQEKNFQMENLTQNFIQEKESFSSMNEKLQKVEEEKRHLMEELKKETEDLFNQLQEKNAQIDQLRESMDTQIASLKMELENQTKSAQVLLEENKVLTETLTGKDTELTRLSATLEQMAQEWEMQVDQRGSDVAESWKLHLESRETEFAQIQDMLRKEINELEEKTNALVNENNELRKNVDAEIRNEVDRVAALQQQINDRQQYINDLTRALQEKQGEVDKLQQELERKNDELLAAQLNLDGERQIVDAILKAVQVFGGDQQVERRAESIISLLSEKENQIAALKRDLEEVSANLSHLREEYNRKHEALNMLTDEKNETITALTNRLQEVQNLKDYESENVQNLQQNLLECQQIHSSFTGALQEKNSKLEAQENELLSLKRVLEERQREQDIALENLSQQYRISINEQTQEIDSLKRRLLENENHYEELLSSRDSDMEGVHLELRQQSEVITNKSREVEELSSQLGVKSEECATLQKTIQEQNVLLEDENKQLTELKAIIEEQVLKIEELKQELYHKSNDYDSLIAEVDLSSRTSIEASKPEETSRHRVVEEEEEEDLSEPVSRAELDLALYMLHQRDVRCEELTVELTQLLEERDTLQLRLSNVIREKEELGRKLTKEEEGEATTSSSKVESVETPDSLLSTKLSELKTVGYRKDKTIVDEQEQRRLQQFNIMQQHRDAASRLPPEAAARLVDASYTLSRDVQSPSKVLLNWLWGRSTPKVNNI